MQFRNHQKHAEKLFLLSEKGSYMARFKRLDVLNTMVSNGVVPVFYNNNIETVKHVIQAVYKGGSRIIEFTNRGDFAFEVFGQMEKYCAEKMPDMI